MSTRWMLLPYWAAALAACACSSKSVPSEDKAPASAGPAVEKAPVAKAEKGRETPVFDGPGKWLPKTAGPFALSSNPRYFGPENLYDLINGGAEIYTEFGLVRMVTADYTDKQRKGVTVTVEIYDMGAPVGAFGRFARFLKGKRDLEGVGKGLPPDLVPYGLMGTSNASFWKGRHLVNLILLDESPTATMEAIAKTSAEVLPTFAGTVAAGLPGPVAPPEALAWFPEPGRVSRSETYEARDVGGIKGLGAGFAAEYRKDDAAFSLFITAPSTDVKKLETVVSHAASEEKPDRLQHRVAEDRIIGYRVTSEVWPGGAAALAKKTLASVRLPKTAR